MKMPAIYDEMLEASTKRLEYARTTAMRAVARTEEQVAHSRDAITRATVAFLTTGIAEQPKDSYGLWAMRSDGQVRRWYTYFRRLAKDTGRPFVHFSVYEHHLTIERRKYTEPLVAMFLLAGRHAEDCRKYPNIRSGDVVSYVKTPTLWRINCYTETGIELLAQWRERCRTEPEMRKALRLP